MRTGRPKVALIVTEDERRRLDSLAHSVAIGATGGAAGAHHRGVCGRRRQPRGRQAPLRDTGDGVQVARPLRAAAPGWSA